VVRGALIRSYPAQWSAGRGLGKPVSDNCADRGRDDAISNLIDRPILQDRFGFGSWINRPDDGHNAHQHTDHLQGDGDYPKPSDIAGSATTPRRASFQSIVRLLSGNGRLPRDGLKED